MAPIREWLENLGLGQYVETFEAEQVTLSDVPDLTEDDLKVLGLPLGPRKRILRAAGDLGTTPADSQQSPSDNGTQPVSEGAERRQLTILFCDMVGSTALSEKLDPEELRELMQTYQRECTKVVKYYGGHVAQYLGDGLMVYFGWPRAYENDAERAVRTGLEIVEAVKSIDSPEPLQVRIGMSTGPVVVGASGSGDASIPKAAVGETPNHAARLQGIARPNNVIISAVTRRLTGGMFEYEDLGEQDLKGVVEPIHAYGVIGESDKLGRFEAQTIDGLTPMVGREHEIGLLTDAWEKACEGEAQVVLLGGEPGIGKSRIIEALRERVSGDDHMIVRYQCSPYHTTSAYYPLITQMERACGFTREDSQESKLDKFESMMKRRGVSSDAIPLFAAMLSLPLTRFPDLGLSPKQQKQLTKEVMGTYIVEFAREHPALVLFEDAHWCDPTTLDVWSEVIDRIADSQVLLVITHRPEFASPWASRGHVTNLLLNRLGRRQSVDIIEKVTGGKTLPNEVLEQIVAKTDGVPLFVQELTKTVLESGLMKDTGVNYELTGPLPDLAIPATLHDSLMARLDRLPSVRETAQVGACIGREFAYEVLSAVSVLSDEVLRSAIAELVAGEIVFSRGAPPNCVCTFRHALIQDTAHESLLRKRRREIHQRVAEVLLERFPETAETQPEVLAQHFMAANQGKPAADYWQKAGERAAAHFAHAEAVSHFTKALEALDLDEGDRDQPENTLKILFGLIASYRILGRSQDALDALDRAETLAKRASNALELANIHYQRGNIYFPMGNVGKCRNEHAIALAYAKTANSPEFEARARGGLADADYMQGRMLTAFTNFDRCIDLSRTHGFPEIEYANLPMRGWGRYYQCNVTDAFEDCLVAIEGSVRSDNHRAEMLARSASFFFLWEMGKITESQEQTIAVSKLTQRLGARNWEPFNLLNLALIVADDDIREAKQLATEAVKICRETGISFVGPWALGVLAVVTDNVAQQSEALNEGASLLESCKLAHCHLWFYRHAIDASLKRGSWDAVRQYADALEGFTEDEKLPWADFFIGRARAIASFASGSRGDDTHRQLERLRAQAERSQFMVAKRALDEACANAAAAS